MNQPDFELVSLKGGRQSIRSRAHGETMHIGSDPRTEAMELHIRQQRLVDRIRVQGGSPGPFVIWDVGLGPAGNALTVIDTLRDVEAPVDIHSFEISTEILEFAVLHASGLDYLAGSEASIAALLANQIAFPAPHIRWYLHRGDFRECLHQAPSPAAIFHDPYSPARNPEMWSLETFRAEFGATSPRTPCLATNYTRSTAVRVTMALAGWFVGIGVPTGEKDQTTIAGNRLDLLERPLDRAWLARVRASTNAAPLRNGIYARGPISEEDYATLATLPQFQ